MLAFFIDFCSISQCFWQDLERILDGFGKVFWVIFRTFLENPDLMKIGVFPKELLFFKVRALKNQHEINEKRM